LEIIMRGKSPLASFPPHRVAYVATGAYRPYIPPSCLDGQIDVRVWLTRSYSTMRSLSFNLEKLLKLSFYDAEPITVRRIIVENAMILLGCVNSEPVRQRFLRGDALLIESTSKRVVGVHARLLQRERGGT
jgi:hypothetical protein